MIQKIVISCINNLAVIIKKNKIQELIVVTNTYQVHDIYLSSVQKIFTNIDAAFVNLSLHGKNGFVHVSDSKVYKRLHKHKDILTSLSLGQILLVQVLKEPTQSKGPRVTSNIYLTGNYAILMPFNNTLCISKRIYDKNERMYLHGLGTLIKPTTMGLLFKESAAGITEEKLIQDIISLKKQWNFIQKSAIASKCPTLLYKDTDIVQKVLKKLCHSSIKSIVIDSKVGFKKVHYALNNCKRINNIFTPQIQLYSKPNCILSNFNIKYAMVQVLKPRVQLCSGAYIVIESVEALTIIDVNSGSFNNAASSREAVLKTNCLAAVEVAYQLQIRNINGIVIIDFIDMPYHKDQVALLKHFYQVLQLDSAKPQIIQLTELGLVELTRCRKERSLLEVSADPEINLFHDLIVSNNGNKYKINLINNYNCMDVNAIFFKRRFAKFLLIKSYDFDLSTSMKILIACLPVIYNYLIPIFLYSFLFSQNAISVIK